MAVENNGVRDKIGQANFLRLDFFLAPLFANIVYHFYK